MMTRLASILTMTLTLAVPSPKQAETAAMRGRLYLGYCNHHAFEMGILGQ